MSARLASIVDIILSNRWRVLTDSIQTLRAFRCVNRVQLVNIATKLYKLLPLNVFQDQLVRVVV